MSKRKYKEMSCENIELSCENTENTLEKRVKILEDIITSYLAGIHNVTRNKQNKGKPEIIISKRVGMIEKNQNEYIIKYKSCKCFESNDISTGVTDFENIIIGGHCCNCEW